MVASDAGRRLLSLSSLLSSSAADLLLLLLLLYKYYSRSRWMPLLATSAAES